MRESNARKLSRRRFLQQSVIATGVMILPARVLGRDGGPSANNRLNIAGIGVGGQGAANLRQLESENT